MKSLKVDRIDNGYVICMDEENKFYGISVDELPAKAKSGDVIVINDSGEITVK